MKMILSFVLLASAFGAGATEIVLKSGLVMERSTPTSRPARSFKSSDGRIVCVMTLDNHLVRENLFTVRENAGYDQDGREIIRLGEWRHAGDPYYRDDMTLKAELRLQVVSDSSDRTYDRIVVASNDALNVKADVWCQNQDPKDVRGVTFNEAINLLNTEK